MSIPGNFRHSYKLPWGEVRAANYKPPIPKRHKSRNIARGLKFERDIGRRLWFLCKELEWEYRFQLALRDPRDGGVGIPDHVLYSKEKNQAFVIETKLTFSLGGMEQLQRYVPLVASYFSSMTSAVQICRNLSPRVLSAGARRLATIENIATISDEGPYYLQILEPRLLEIPGIPPKIEGW